MLCRLFDCGRKKGKSSQVVPVPPPVEAVAIKLAIMGDVGVGKSQLVNRFANDKFDDRPESTISIGISHKSVKIENTEIKILIYDMAGQERFRLINTQYCKPDMFAYAVVFDLTNMESFERAKRMVEELWNLRNEARILLVGNKSDLADRVISPELLREYTEAPENHIGQYFEVSAKDNKNVNDFFDSISKMKLAEISQQHQSGHRSIPQTPREVIMAQLENQIHKVSQYRSFDDGFIICSQSRAINREINYEFAQELLKKLRTSSATLDEVFDDFETKRLEFIKSKGFDQKEGYVERRVWGGLNQVNRQAQKFIEREKHRDKLDIKLGKY